MYDIIIGRNEEDKKKYGITPMMPFFPLVVVFAQRYVKNTGIGTVVALMLPYSIVFFVAWTAFLIAYWQLGIPLGIQAPYTYPS